LLQARKVFRQTRVLFPTDRGLPAVCSIGSIWDLDGLKERLGIEVKTVSYEQLSGEMEQVLEDAAAKQAAQQMAQQLVSGADRSFIEQPYVERSLLFYRAVRNLMARHHCNAFTIECFEFCSSRLPDRWQITPCLIHSLQRDLGHASSCEADLGSLLAMRMLMSVAGRSCHQGNSDPRSAEAFRINHSVPALKMNGFEEPDLPYQLGRFVTKGWGTKVVVDFMSQDEKTVTVARVDPSATRLLVLRGELVGASGWGQDDIGCSVEALIRPPADRLDEFLRKRLDYGNHLQWVYGDWTEDLRRLGEMLGLQVEVIA
jgi:L-fucose isomerase-like protein